MGLGVLGSVRHFASSRKQPLTYLYYLSVFLAADNQLQTACFFVLQSVIHAAADSLPVCIAKLFLNSCKVLACLYCKAVFKEPHAGCVVVLQSVKQATACGLPDCSAKCPASILHACTAKWSQGVEVLVMQLSLLVRWRG